MIAVRENLRLQREEGASRIDKINTRQVVLKGNLLGAKVLLHRYREIRPALNRGIIRDDNGAVAFNGGHSRNDSCTRRLIPVHAACGQSAEFQKRGGGVEQLRDAVTNKHLAAIRVPFSCGFASALLYCGKL